MLIEELCIELMKGCTDNMFLMFNQKNPIMNI